jgi:DNA-binding transcriptional ArsR family regulator
MDDALKALAHPMRRQILERVSDEERTAGDIAAGFSVTRPAVSQHLTILKNAGLLAERRDGTRRLYRTRPAALHDVVQGLATIVSAPPAATPARVDSLETERFIAMRPNALWRLLADPAQLSRWKGPLRGSFLESHPPSRIVWSAGMRAGEDDRARVELDLVAESGGTLLRIKHVGPSGELWEHYLDRLESISRGWEPGPDQFSEA